MKLLNQRIIFNLINLVKNKIANKKKLYFLLFCLKKVNDSRFIDLVLNKKDIIYCKNFGDQNKNKLFYFIDIETNGMGFGAYLRWVIHVLYDADSFNAIPVIKFGKGCPYLEKNQFMNTDNPFEYYFNQPTKYNVKDIFESQRVIVFNIWSLVRIDETIGIIKNSNDMPIGYQNITNEYLKNLGAIYKNYIFLNEHSERFIKQSIKSVFPKDWGNKKILAVHVRGTDFALHWDQHPNIVQAEDFFYVIDKALLEKNFQYIFLATDDSARLELFKNRYKEKLLYFKDVHRSDGKINVSFEKIDRPYNNYLNGLEVLRDMYTMAYCNGFIAGLSQVSVSTRIINRSLDKQFEYEKIIDKGIYKI